RLLDRDRHFARLAVAEADLAVAIAHHRQRGEGELAAALDGLADAVDRDQLLDHAVVDLFAVAAAAARFSFVSHVPMPCFVSGCTAGAAYGCGMDRWTTVPHRRRRAPDAARIGRRRCDDMAVAMPFSSIRTAGRL